ncbi:hypothetical protein C8A03DRAFT_32970 [Achaetomium macrosporum]|uniref:Uncharacterized protein n=1 Tax=Achaetomium macrosporum TaxID=79813 RepID=A0AAN7CBG1_9PEZI|nr:hypothetical protein C8A03DRAFT_32970 [Achaetomium macrosporum]
MENDDAATQFKQQCLDRLDRILDGLQDLPRDGYVVDNDQLAVLDVRRARPLDVDDNSVDPAARFFQPRFSLDEARRMTEAYSAEPCARPRVVRWTRRCLSDPSPDPESFRSLCWPVEEARRRFRWVMAAVGDNRSWRLVPDADEHNFGVWRDSPWVESSVHAQPPDLTLRVCASPIDSVYPWLIESLLLLGEDRAHINAPHLGAVVLGSAESGEGDVLHSELIAAVGPLQLQFRRDDFWRHHTLPALVFSFQHDRLARITQSHFDGQSLVLRQSRLLDLYGDEPTVDAYHMMRWIANRPIGDARFGTADVKEEREIRDNHDSSAGKLPIMVGAD